MTNRIADTHCSTIQTILPLLLHSQGSNAALSNPDRLWPAGKLYYAFDPITLDTASPKNIKIRELVIESMDSIRGKVSFLQTIQCAAISDNFPLQVPCIQFIDKDTLNLPVEDYVFIKRSGSANPCYSQIGKVGGKQELGLNLGCFPIKDGKEDIEIGVHELMHALGKCGWSTEDFIFAGFAHEQNRPDREKHIVINQANIEMGRETNFVKRNWTNKEEFGSWSSDDDLDPQLTPYDRSSVLHYR